MFSNKTIIIQEILFPYALKYCYTLPLSMSCNVLAVTDVWAGIQGLCEAKTARPNVGEGGVGMAKP